MYGLGCVFYWFLSQIFNCHLFTETKETYNYYFFSLKKLFRNQKYGSWRSRLYLLNIADCHFTQFERIWLIVLVRELTFALSFHFHWFLQFDICSYMLDVFCKAQNLKIHFPCHPFPPLLASAFLLYYFPLGKWKRTWEIERGLTSCSENETWVLKFGVSFRTKHLQVRSVFPAAELNTKSILLLFGFAG